MASHPTRQTWLSHVCLCWINYSRAASSTPDSICSCAKVCVLVCLLRGGCLLGIALTPVQPCCRMILVCGLCACANPSGNDSEATGPVGVVQRCRFQVPVSTLLLQHFFFYFLVSHTNAPTQTGADVWRRRKNPSKATLPVTVVPICCC